MQVNESSLFFVFDVESVGLYGGGFAVGWTVIDLDGKEHESGLFVADWRNSDGYNQKGVTQWLEANLPPMAITYQNVSELYFDFFNVLQRWLPQAKVNHPKVHSIWADWGYPVEASFLKRCRSEAYWHIEEDPSWLMPAPLHEIATFELAAGITEELPRLPPELPEHNPLNDARHSARKLVRAMAKLKQLSGSGFNVEQYNNPGVPTAPVFCHYEYKIVGQTKTWGFHSMRECTPDVLEDELRRAREKEPEQDYQIVQLFCVKNWNDLRVRMKVGKWAYGSMETL